MLSLRCPERTVGLHSRLSAARSIAACPLTIRSSGPLRVGTVNSNSSRQRPLSSSVIRQSNHIACFSKNLAHHRSRKNRLLTKSYVFGQLRACRSNAQFKLPGKIRPLGVFYWLTSHGMLHALTPLQAVYPSSRRLIAFGSASMPSGPLQRTLARKFMAELPYNNSLKRTAANRCGKLQLLAAAAA